MSEKIIHFGEFIRWNRLSAGKTLEAFGRDIDVTARRVIAIEALANPEVHHTTFVKLAKALGVDPEQFDRVWRSTPVPVTTRKAGPTTDEAHRFSIACAASGVTPQEGMRRLRSWIIAQDPRTQKQALGFISATRNLGFTHPVDHLQEPAAAVRARVGRKAASSGKSRGSAATSESKHR